MTNEQRIPHISGGWGTIVADPPWSYTAGKATRIAPRYDCMSVDQIRALPIADYAARDCALFLWSTSSFLEEALDVMHAWEFQYRTTIVWAKGRVTEDGTVVRHIGMGSYVRCAHELVLVGRRGNWTAPRERRNIPSWFISPRTLHSRKPPELMDIAEMIGPEPRIELFARERREGWEAWGDEITPAYAPAPGDVASEAL